MTLKLGQLIGQTKIVGFRYNLKQQLKRKRRSTTLTVYTGWLEIAS